MITYDSQFNRFTYTGVNGNQVTVNWFDGDVYNAVQKIYEQQKDADSTNANAVKDYTDKLGGYQQSMNDGRNPSIPLPVMPQKLIISDLGVVSHVPFDPPLPVYTPLVASGGGSTSIKTVVNTPSDIDVVKQMLTIINGKLDSLIKGKGN
jgi:hypothetical protein